MYYSDSEHLCESKIKWYSKKDLEKWLAPDAYENLQ